MEKQNKNSKAKIEANNRYRQKKYDSISLAVPKGERDNYTAKIKTLGYTSVNSFIIQAINEKLDRES